MESIAKDAKGKPAIYASWDCPNIAGFAPIWSAIELYQQHRMGLPIPELSAAGRDAFRIIDDTVYSEDRWLGIAKL